MKRAGFTRLFQVCEAENPRRASEVVLRVAALQRNCRQRLLAGDLEYRTEQDRAPDYLAPVVCRDGVNPGACEVAVGRREIEVEVDWIRHAASQCTSFLLIIAW